jgi:hypothetical protein
MLLSRSATIVLFALITSLSLHMPSRPSAQESVGRSAERIIPPDAPPASCRVTLPADDVYDPSPQFGPSRRSGQFYFGTDKLWTVLPVDGTYRGPYRGGSHDFVYDDKLPWYRRDFAQKGVPLIVRGRRLDGPAPSFIETNEYFDYNPGGIVGGISIPAYGCWEITGHYDDQEVTFTVWVTELRAQEPSSVASSSEIQPEEPTQTVVVPRVQVDGETAAEALVYRVLPEIPPAAQATKTYGTVVLHAIIGSDGRTHDLRYVSGPQPLVQAAMDTVQWYQYRLPVVPVWPLRTDEEEIDTTVAVSFPPPSD